MRQIVDLRNIRMDGRILDIGGGGEGVIARLCGDGVAAIDIRKEELQESPDIGLKIIMDARDLQFLDATFDNATCFYSLMYMRDESVEKSLAEAYRTLKSGGYLWIWDAVMPPPADEVFVANLEIRLPNERFTVDYGVGGYEERNLGKITKLCEDAGFSVIESGESGMSFFLKVRK
jgi:ubiquinone/menaquinone biosynthesis C-methylase UbiE